MINLTQGVSETAARKLAREVGVDELCAKILISRGYTDLKSATKFLYGNLSELTSPFVYSGLKEAVTEIRETIEAKGTVVFYGDYDCDGIGAVSILTCAFTQKGINNFYYIPNRTEEGYGLNSEAIKKIKNLYNPDLLITVDCGINSVAEVETALSLGIKIIVTDHHRPGNELPDCTIVNPCFNEDLTPLCGAGVAFYLVRGLFGDEYAYNFLDICALSTVADVVPLVDDNRILVRCGLSKIKSGRGNIGIKELAINSGVSIKQIDTYDIAFKLAPRLNAAGRLGEAHPSVKLLTTEDVTEAKFLAEELGLRNAERQDLSQKIINAAMGDLENYDFGKYKVIVLHNPDWEEGVNGIAAARLAEYFYLPTILLTDSFDGTIKGSARSIGGVNIFEALCKTASSLIKFGGHAMAAGLSLKKSELDAFRDELNAVIKELPNEVFTREIRVDAEYPISNLSARNFANMEKLQPFGYKNATPVFYDSAPQLKFSVMKERHLKSGTSFGAAVCFGKAFALPAFNSAQSKAVAYSLEKNYFNGNEYDQVKIKNLYYSDYVVSDAECFTAFCEFSIAAKCKNGLNGYKKDKSGFNLDVFFDFKEFEKFTAENPEYLKIYKNSDVMELRHTAVLSPSTDFPFNYYNNVRIHGAVTDGIKKFFSSTDAVFVGNGKIDIPEFDINEMREVYKILRAILPNTEIKTAVRAHEAAVGRGFTMCFEKFLLYFYILMDIELLKKESGDILSVNNQKTDVTKSQIYGYANGRNA